MPELPEIATVVSSLSLELPNLIIREVCYESAHVFSSYTNKRAADVLPGLTFKQIERFGKYLLFQMDDYSTIICHFRMTGQIFLQKNPDIDKHVHLVLHLHNGIFLLFRDIRKFGRFRHVLYDEYRLFLPKGCDALGLAQEYLLKTMEKCPQRQLKSFLLDQQKIAGIGNIYADEICFDIKIRPDKALSFVSPDLLKKSIEKILREAIFRKGTTFSDYRDTDGSKGSFQNFLQVYGRKTCKTCSQQLIVCKIAGRTTRFCENCQQ